MRIQAPTYTQTPNDLFDHWLPLLKESELKVLLVIMRKTFGWHKVRDRISISQLSKLTGLTEETVIIATKALQKKGVIIKQVVGEIGKQQTFYELVVEDSNNSYPSENPTGGEIHPPPPLGFTPLGESEAQKKPSSTKENFDDDEASAKSDDGAKEKESNQGDVEFLDAKGTKQRISTSDIFLRLLKSPYSPEVIRAAIGRIRKIKSPITDFMEYFITICDNIVLQTKQKEVKSKKEVVKKSEFNINEWLYEWKSYEELIKSGDLTLEYVENQINRSGHYDEWKQWRRAFQDA